MTATSDRRDFLRASTLSTAALALPTLMTPAHATSTIRNCIMIHLIGGPAGIDTFDPHPDAPLEARSPFGAIATRIPGVYFTELFPRLADRADRLTIIRSLHHQAAPIHETGLQLLQTGQIVTRGSTTTHIGQQIGDWLHIGPELGFMGVSVPMGQENIAESLPTTSFAESCQKAVHAIERGRRFITINMFESVYDQLTWDCHGDYGSLSTRIDDYRVVGPMFDIAFSMLLDDLHNRGLLESTLVVAVGEIGRKAHWNERGGRNHWNGCWSGLLAGGGTTGGTVIGASDRIGAYPTDRPIDLRMIPATILRKLDVKPSATFDGVPIIQECF